MLESFAEFLFGLSGWLVALVVFALAAGESALLLGFFLPGELAVVLGGVLASRGEADLAAMIPASILGAILGDNIGYWLGKRFGAPWLHRRVGERWARVERAFVRWGAASVFVGKFSAFLRAVVPAAAGAAGIPYRTFALWNALGCLVWGAGFCLLGFFAGESYERVLALGGRIGMSVAAGVLILAAIALIVHRIRRRRRNECDRRAPPGIVR